MKIYYLMLTHQACHVYLETMYFSTQNAYRFSKKNERKEPITHNQHQKTSFLPNTQKMPLSRIPESRKKERETTTNPFQLT